MIRISNFRCFSASIMAMEVLFKTSSSIGFEPPLGKCKQHKKRIHPPQAIMITAKKRKANKKMCEVQGQKLTPWCTQILLVFLD